MAEAQVADASVKAKFKIEGRQLYKPPLNLDHEPLIDQEFVPDRGMRGHLWPLTAQQRADVDAMFAEGDERRAATLNVEEVQRSIDLCKRTGVRVPRWMTMALDLLTEQRRAKYPEKAKLPEA